MNDSIDRLADALKVGNKIKGFRQPVYKPDGRIDHYARQMIEVMAGDVVEACAAAVKSAPDRADSIVMAQTKGCGAVHPETIVTILADDLFHILDLAKA